jgi:hypothetical protein
MKKQNFLDFGVIAKRRHHQRTGPPPGTLRQLMNVDRLQSLLVFGADPFIMKK